ncbi:MAG: PaeR7I family type II restriction endonuclease [Muribaculaceae bacterium]|nr:PaeR7I family type II restriction endonuclease [Muribaculaceae bacterium]
MKQTFDIQRSTAMAVKLFWATKNSQLSKSADRSNRGAVVREKQFSSCGAPWVGYLMLIGYDEKSTVPVRNYTNHFPVLPEFENASYIDRYRILCEKLIRERLYTHTCLIWTKDENSFGVISPEISIESFIYSLQGYLSGCINEFED